MLSELPGRVIIREVRRASPAGSTVELSSAAGLTAVYPLTEEAPHCLSTWECGSRVEPQCSELTPRFAYLYLRARRQRANSANLLHCEQFLCFEPWRSR